MPTLRMPNINQVALSGRVVSDPEFRFMDNGAARLRARIAVNRSYRDRNDKWQEETSFFDIVLWQKFAETLCRRLVKGTPVFVTGRLSSRNWRDDDNKPQFRVEIQVRNLQILSREDGETVEAEEEQAA